MPTTVMSYEEKMAADVEKRRKQREERILYLTMLTTSNGVFSELLSPQQGNAFTADYSALFRNNTNNMTRVQVFADLATPGTVLVLALRPDRADTGKIDQLALTANGKSESISVILVPNETLYARSGDPVFPLALIDTIRVRVFDPSKLMSYNKLFPEMQ